VQHLLSHVSLVESQLITLEDVAVATSTLARSRADNGIQTSSLELSLQRRLNLAGLLQSLFPLGLDALADLLLLSLGFLALSSPTQSGAVVCFVPLSERSSVDLDNGGLGQGVGSDEFVVGRVVGDDDDTDFASDTFTTPAEVARFQAERSVFCVTTSGSDKMDSFVADTGVRWLTTLLEGSLLSVIGALCTSGGPLVAAVS